jgi:hypothetical protein
VTTKIIRRIFVFVALILSLGFQLCLLLVFLAPQWLLRLESWLLSNPGQTDWSKITHPGLDQEIEQVFINTPWVKPGLITLTLAVLVVNSRVLYRLWKALQELRGRQQG